MYYFGKRGEKEKAERRDFYWEKRILIIRRAAHYGICYKFVWKLTRIKFGYERTTT